MIKILFGILILAAIFAYFIPVIMAAKRKHPAQGGVLVANLFSGILLILNPVIFGVVWIAILIWAYSGKDPSKKS